MRSDSEDRPAIAERLFASSLMLASLTLVVCAAAFFLIGEPTLPRQHPTGLPKFFALFQDIPVAVAMIAFFAIAARAKLPSTRRPIVLRPWQVVSIVLTMALAAWLVRIYILFDYDLSRDEQMVALDSAIYGRGLLFQPFPPEWREWYAALNANFLLPIGDREGWLSAYLPGNALIHALLETIMTPSLVSPVLLAIASLALWRIACRIWPDSPGTQAVVMLLFAGSSQAVFMAGTRYAMTPHLTLNLCWLWLFLQRRPAAHAGAIAVGFVATGLHQAVFHPLFVLPFLDLLRRERHWRLLAGYIVCYGAIGLFWLAWPSWVAGHGIHPVPAEFRPDGVSYLDRLQALPPFAPLSSGLMGVNILRFFTWEHLLLAPLLILGLRTAFRGDPLCRALALGMVALLLAMLVLMAPQTHGWGYRYIHGYVGSAVLIAGFGWHRLEQGGTAPTRAFLLATALSLLVLAPLHAWMARGFVKPYADADAALSRIPADIVIIDENDVPFGVDLVRNEAFLQNRPIRLQSKLVTADQLPRLCAGGRSLAFADAPSFAAIDRLFNAAVPAGPSGPHQRLKDAARHAGCRVVPAEGG